MPSPKCPCAAVDVWRDVIFRLDTATPELKCTEHPESAPAPKPQHIENAVHRPLPEPKHQKLLQLRVPWLLPFHPSHSQSTTLTFRFMQPNATVCSQRFKRFLQNARSGFAQLVIEAQCFTPDRFREFLDELDRPFPCESFDLAVDFVNHRVVVTPFLTSQARA